MKKNNTEANIQIDMEQPAQNDTLETMRPSDELQVYYNDAYMREKQRFNDMFGLLEESEPSPDVVKRILLENAKNDVDLSNYVSLNKFKKVKATATFFVVTTLIFAAAAAYFALSFLNIL